MAKSVSKYTEAMVAVILAKADEVGVLDANACAEIAARKEFVAAGVTARGVIAKVRSLGLDYAKKEKVSKTGDRVATKETLASEIEAALGLTGLASLAKAEKGALRILRDFASDYAGETSSEDFAEAV